jgi:hypothetical protein
MSVACCLWVVAELRSFLAEMGALKPTKRSCLGWCSSSYTITGSSAQLARGHTGLVAYRRGWFSKRRYCSRQCRDTFVAMRPTQSQHEGKVTTYFEWLFLERIENLQQNLKPAVIRIKAR